jgi:hypothetical protein
MFVRVPKPCRNLNRSLLSNSLTGFLPSAFIRPAFFWLPSQAFDLLGVDAASLNQIQNSKIAVFPSPPPKKAHSLKKA